jgi:hypothetical protein
MKINSDESIEAAKAVFRAYGSWTAARAAGYRDKDGVLVIPVPQDAEPQVPDLKRKAG